MDKALSVLQLSAWAGTVTLVPEIIKDREFFKGRHNRKLCKNSNCKYHKTTLVFCLRLPLNRLRGSS